MLICGSPMGWLMPLRMPKSTGLSRACAALALERRLKPNRASLTAVPAEGVRLVQREELSQRVELAAEARDGVATKNGFMDVLRGEGCNSHEAGCS